MSDVTSTTTDRPPSAAPELSDRPKLTKKALTADHPTWCPGCGDFSVLALYYKLLEKRQVKHENIATIAGIGCSSRFPYFVQAHGAHFIHGRALPFASGVALSRPDLHVFVFGGDGDAFSIGGNHFTHTARKNVNLTYVVMDNWVYGLTKKQTSPTSPVGFKSKTDIWGAMDRPVNPMKQAISAGATFVARTTHSNPKHVLEMMEAAMEEMAHRDDAVYRTLLGVQPVPEHLRHPGTGGADRHVNIRGHVHTEEVADLKTQIAALQRSMVAQSKSLDEVTAMALDYE